MKKGFTLVGLLFVVAILGMLAAIIFPVMQTIYNRSHKINNITTIPKNAEVDTNSLAVFEYCGSNYVVKTVEDQICPIAAKNKKNLGNGWFSFEFTPAYYMDSIYILVCTNKDTRFIRLHP